MLYETVVCTVERVKAVKGNKECEVCRWVAIAIKMAGASSAEKVMFKRR